MPKLSHYVSDQSKETYRKGTHTIAGGADQFAPHLAKSNASIAPAQPVQQVITHLVRIYISYIVSYDVGILATGAGAAISSWKRSIHISSQKIQRGIQ